MATTGSASLTGVRVVDVSRILAGPLCTHMLGDHGAEVVKVEPPTGDETRRWGPPFVSDDASAYFAAVNRNKANVGLDLTTADGQRLLGELLGDADVLVENFKAGTLARWGYDDTTIRSRYPTLIHCRITGFGVDGPMGGMPGFDAVLQAYSGLMSINGEADGPALRVGVPVVDMVTGIMAFSGILLALVERSRTGLGQLVDCTLLDTAISLLHPHSASHLCDGRTPQRLGSAHPTVAPYDTFDAADGPIFIGVGSDAQFRALCKVLSLPHVVDDDSFATNAARLANLPALRALLADRVRTRNREPLALQLMTAGVPASPVRDVGEALRDPQVRHRDMVVSRGDYSAVGIPIKLDRSPGSVRSVPRDHGADTRAVLARLGYSDERVDALIADGVVGTR